MFSNKKIANLLPVNVIVLLLLSGMSVKSEAAERQTYQILPESITLTGPAARQQLIVMKLQRGELAGQPAPKIEWKSNNPQVAVVEDGVVVPKGNGSAVLTALIGDTQTKARVHVDKYDQPQAWIFRNHVQSVLSKAGCNSGACHGAGAGKNGFKLSLRGYDPDYDYLAITREAGGRRIVPDDPGRSLLLTKPTGMLPHKGGVRFKPDSREYEVITQWLAAGHPQPKKEDPRMERLEILPKHVKLQKGDQLQFLIQAAFSDGTVEDVTRWAKFSTTNQSVVKVDDQGYAEITGYGEGSIVAWYLSENVIGTVTVPYENPFPKQVLSRASSENLIDRLVVQKLSRLRLPPSPPADDATFLRRAYLDTTGTLPTVQETKAFLAEASPGKRARLIDDLFERKEFVDYWTYKWSDLLLVSSLRLRPEAVKTYYEWIREQVKQNVPWDQFAREVVTAKGSTLKNGATNFYALHQDPLDISETLSMTFLGMSINCARCHDHPLEKWTNDDYYGMVSLFARVRGKGWGGDFRNGNGDRTIFLTESGEVIQPRTGKPQPPRPLDGEAITFDALADRREVFADWLTGPENPYFSKAIVNRVWANFMGVGLVEAVDDLRLTNPASNAELLEALSEFLIENKYDLKKLMWLILTSKAYQRSSQPLPENEVDERYYSRYYPKRLPAEVLLDAISQVTEVSTKFTQTRAGDGSLNKAGIAVGTRALELNDSSVANYFLETFGRPQRLITCECERSNEPSMSQVLHIMNGATLNTKLEQKENRLSELLKEKQQNGELIDQAYLAALARYPTDSEKQRILEVFNDVDQAEKRAALEDFYWSLLSSREFLFNH